MDDIRSTEDSALILVVDDDAASREPLEVLLQSEGYRIATAASGRQALASIARELPDMILLDVSMPGMDGYELASRVKADPSTAGIPIVMVTGYTGRGARVVGLGSGAEDILSKPVDATELSLKVRNLLRLRLHVLAAPPAMHIPPA